MRAAAITVFVIVLLALMCTGCSPANERAQWARGCTEEGHDPYSCTEAAERLFPRQARP